jgi:hypothetical protein
MKNTVTGAKLTATEARAQSDMESALKYGSHYFRIEFLRCMNNLIVQMPDAE